MNLFRELATYDRVDVLINLNHLEFIQWILPDPTKYVTADKLYGGPRWKPALELEGLERTKFLVDEYETALREIGWRGTSFEMVNQNNQTAYHLVFGTGSPKGMEAIKRAMRSASQTGESRFTDRISTAQFTIPGLDASHDFATEIGDSLFEKYQGQEIGICRLFEDEIDWHGWWLPSDLRKGLRYLENGKDRRIIEVRNPDGRLRKRNSYPDGCIIKFGRPPQQQKLFGFNF